MKKLSITIKPSIILIILAAVLAVPLVIWILYFEIDIRKDSDPLGIDGQYKPTLVKLSDDRLSYRNDDQKFAFSYDKAGTLIGKNTQNFVLTDYQMNQYLEWSYRSDIVNFKVISYRSGNNEGDQFNSLSSISDGQFEKVSMCGGTGHKYELVLRIFGSNDTTIIYKYRGKERTTIFAHPKTVSDTAQIELNNSIASLSCE